MEDIKAMQLEALETAVTYIEKLAPAIKEIVPELRGEEQPDTEDYLAQIVDGINFVLEILNGTISMINEKEVIINIDGVEEKVCELSDAFAIQSHSMIADSLESGILPVLDAFYQVSQAIVAKEAN